LNKKGVDRRRISPGALEALLRHPLPGNVRELENLLERALIVAGDEPVEEAQIAPPTRVPARISLDELEIPDEGLVLEELEKRLIERALAKAEGNKSRAASLLGLTRRTLYSRMERYGIGL